MEDVEFDCRLLLYILGLLVTSQLMMESENTIQENHRLYVVSLTAGANALNGDRCQGTYRDTGSQQF